MNTREEQIELAIKFMNYLDENRPAGKMGLSNAECEDIDKAFAEKDWTKILQYAKKYAKNMENRIELWILPTGNVAVYRGSAFIPTEQLTEEERHFVLNRVCDELREKDLDVEIKKYTENLYNETFGNGQGTLDEFDWDDIATVIEDAAKHFYNPQPHWKPSEKQLKSLCVASRSVSSRRDVYNLDTLYNDLKELM